MNFAFAVMCRLCTSRIHKRVQELLDKVIFSSAIDVLIKSLAITYHTLNPTHFLVTTAKWLVVVFFVFFKTIAP